MSRSVGAGQGRCSGAGERLCRPFVHDLSSAATDRLCATPCVAGKPLRGSDAAVPGGGLEGYPPGTCDVT